MWMFTTSKQIVYGHSVSWLRAGFAGWKNVSTENNAANLMLMSCSLVQKTVFTEEIVVVIRFIDKGWHIKISIYISLIWQDNIITKSDWKTWCQHKVGCIDFGFIRRSLIESYKGSNKGLTQMNERHLFFFFFFVKEFYF